MPPEDLSVYVACPTTRDLSVPTVLSFLNTQEFAFKNNVKVDFTFIVGSLIHHARIVAANKFLESDYSRLFFIDSDIVWTPEEFFSLVIHSQKRDCVVGIYPRKHEQPGYFLRFKKGSETTEDGLMPIEGTGLGFACINRRVIEELTAHAPERMMGGVRQPCIFRCDDDGSELRGEDYAFWADVLKHGFKVWADMSVTVGHIGPKIYRTVLPKETHQDGSTQDSTVK